MLIINEMPASLDATMREKLSRLSPATLGHITSDGFIRGLYPLSTPVAFAGTAVTLRLPSLDSSLMHYVADRIRPGQVLVVDRQGEGHHACLGGMVGFRLKLAQIAGAVIDGPVTDTDELKAYGFPVFHRGIASTTTRIFEPQGELNTPITVGGCAVNPGDVVIGDSDGLFVGPINALVGKVDELLAKQEWELPAKERMVAGEQIAAMSGAERLIEKARMKA